MSVTPQGPRLAAIMADHDKGPEYALVKCIHDGCPNSQRIEESRTVTTEQLVVMFNDLGWSIKPTLCPAHRSGGDR